MLCAIPKSIKPAPSERLGVRLYNGSSRIGGAKPFGGPLRRMLLISGQA